MEFALEKTVLDFSVHRLRDACAETLDDQTKCDLQSCGGKPEQASGSALKATTALDIKTDTE